MRDPKPTDVVFYTVKDAKALIQAGGKMRFEAIVQSDWIAWLVRIDLSDGKVARLYKKLTDEPKVYASPSYTYVEMMETQEAQFIFELQTPELAKIIEFQQKRRKKVLDTMKEHGTVIEKYCKSLGLNMATLFTVLDGKPRRDDVERQICKDFGLDIETTFPPSIADHLGLKSQTLATNSKMVPGKE